MNHGLTYSSFPPRASFLDSNQPVFFSGTKISDNNMFLVKPHMDALSDPTLNIQLFLKKDLHILGIPSHWLL
jgi:hypothetical protein